MVLEPTWVTVILGLLIPLLTGLITKANASATIKQIVTLTLAAATTLISRAVIESGEALFTQELLIEAGMTWGIAIGSYLGIYKPHEINDSLAPTTGLGGSLT